MSIHPDGLYYYDVDGVAHCYQTEQAWLSGKEIEPTEEPYKTIHAERAKFEYARNRVTEYPSNGDQWDMIYKDNKNSTTTHADAIEAIKTKWPKDNSGPVE